MKLSTQTIAADSVVEMLEKIVEFTNRRHAVLTENILNIADDGFVPVDLNVDGFAGVMAQAVAEFLDNDRLVLTDVENVRFGANGTFDTDPAVDHHAGSLLKTDIKEYLRYQIRMYSENLLNRKVAFELLKQRQNLQ